MIAMQTFPHALRHAFQSALRAAALLVGSLTCIATAHAVPLVGEPLPHIAIDDPGRLVPAGDDFDTVPFNTASLAGKVVSIQAMAGRRGIDARNAHYVDALRASKLDNSAFQAVTIVDTDQAMMGTKGFVRGKVEAKQAEFPTSTFVLDADGRARAAWALAKKGYAVIVVDKDGTVLAAKDGVLTDADVAEFVAIIERATGR